jgi:hypothetical protein
MTSSDSRGVRRGLNALCRWESANVRKLVLYGWLPSLQTSVSVSYVIGVKRENVQYTFASFNVNVLTVQGREEKMP